MKITRRTALTVAGGTAAALAAPALVRAQSAARDRIVIISDVHIGDNTPTVWYQRSFHEPFLLALFDYVVANAGRIHELVILGDFVDFWTYPPERRPPGFAEITAANPAIFSPGGKLHEVLMALDGRVSYVAGNHDMGITQADLDALQAPGGRGITLRTGDVYLPAAAGGRLACAHGHKWTMFNAPDASTRLAPLPVGHFATRSFCHMLQKTLLPGQTVADLAGQGIPNGVDFGGLIKSVNASLIDAAINYASQTTGLALDAPILLPSGDTTTLAEAKVLYADVWSNWIAAAGGGQRGELEAIKAALADVQNGTYLSWFAQRLALQTGADLAIFGHTHVPVTGLSHALIDYVNTGFDCPSRADIGKKHPTFVEVDVPLLQAQLKQVTARADGSYAVEDFAGSNIDTVGGYGPTFDYSTYVTIDNRLGTGDLVRGELSAPEGYYVVPPPETIARGTVARFWIQDAPGGAGSAGAVTYAGSGGRSFALRYGCPTGLSSNVASGAPFTSKVGDDAYGPVNAVARRGHPFFVRFDAGV
jgi:UDP-2,3-diacylglucosamine pyrophosphatase LpxH